MNTDDLSPPGAPDTWTNLEVRTLQVEIIAGSNQADLSEVIQKSDFTAIFQDVTFYVPNFETVFIQSPLARSGDFFEATELRVIDPFLPDGPSSLTSEQTSTTTQSTGPETEHRESVRI
jgi:hypothetical protein